MAGLIIISHRLDPSNPSVVPEYPVPPLRGTGVKPVIKPEANPVTNSDNHTGTGGGSCGKYGSKPPPPVILP